MLQRRCSHPSFTIGVKCSHLEEGTITGEELQHNRASGRIIAVKRTPEDRRAREFERLYRESYATVYGWARVRMSNDADTEDIVAEAYLKAARAFGSFDPKRAKFATWVIAIAKNCMATHFRKVRPTTTLDDVPESAFAVDGDYDEVCDPMVVKQLLTCLSNEERELVALKYHEGLRNTEIAEELGINPSTVSTKLARALEKMRVCAGGKADLL